MKLKDALAEARQLFVLAYPLQGIQAQVKISKSYFNRELSPYYSEYMYRKGESTDPDCSESEVVWYEEGGLSPILATYYPSHKEFVIGN
tara:strand:+ start:4951 stop:5217 length:267 start_codon:yes stop_codon:yes gene_type:complete